MARKATTKRAPVKGQYARKGEIIKKAPRTIGKKASATRGGYSGPEVRMSTPAGRASIQG